MQRKNHIFKWFACLCMALVFIFNLKTPVSAADKIRITCVGDSITDGIGASKGSKNYPGQLQTLLGDDYTVTKCGFSGAFACESTDICWRPYISGTQYQDSLKSEPDIVIIMIGTNDASENMCWGKIKNGVDVPGAFREGYENLIKTYQALPTNPRIILATPLSVSNDKNGNNNENRQYNNENGTIPIIKELAEKYELPLIDMFHITEGWSMDNYLTDGLHPNDDGYSLLARIFAKYVKEEENNLQTDKEYRIVSRLSGKALDIEDGSSDNNAKICQMPIDEDKESQLWTLEAIDGGYYQIINKSSKKALEVPDASRDAGKEIVQADKKNANSQKWFIDTASDGYYAISPKMSITFAMDVNGASKEDGAHMIQWPYGGADNQQWKFEVVEPKYTVTFDSDGGNSIENQTVQKGEKAARPSDPVREGYIFKGWNLEDTGYSFDTEVTEDITLKAVWEEVVPEKKEFTITFDSAEGSTVSNQLVTENEKGVKPEDPTKEGYHFLGWYLDEEAYDFDAEVTADITLVAKWEKIEEAKDDTNGDGSSKDNPNGDDSSKDDTDKDDFKDDDSDKDDSKTDNSSTDDSADDNSSKNDSTNNGNIPTTGNTGIQENKQPAPTENNTVTPTPQPDNVSTNNDFQIGKTFESGKFLYKITNASDTYIEVEVVKALKNNYTTLTIPKSVTYNGKTCIVTSLARGAFKNNKRLKKITIDKNVVKIGAKAFYNCKSLSKVIFKKNNLKSVGLDAFTKTSKKLIIKTGNRGLIKKYKKLFMDATTNVTITK